MTSVETRSQHMKKIEEENSHQEEMVEKNLPKEEMVEKNLPKEPEAADTEVKAEEKTSKCMYYLGAAGAAFALIVGGVVTHLVKKWSTQLDEPNLSELLT